MGAWVSAALLLVVAAVTGDRHYLVEALGPTIAGTVFTTQVLTKRYDAVVVFATTTTTITVTYALAGDDSTLIPASVSLVLVAMLGTIFVERHGVAYVIAGTALTMAAPLIWRRSEWASTGLAMAISFLLGAVILLRVRWSAAETNRRYQQMFELAPIGLMEQDWTRAVQMTAVIPGETPEELRNRLERDPEFVRLIVASVRVTRANTEIGAIAGVPPSRLVDTSVLSDILPAPTDDWVDQIVAIVHAGEGYYTEHPSQRYTGEEIYVGIRSISVVRTPNSVRRLVAIDDITEQRLAEQAAAELVHAKDRFIASVSHELRTPLAAIVGFASELSSGAVTAEERSEISATIHEQATDMAHIVEDLLVAARADAGSITVKPKPVDAGEVARTVLHQSTRTDIEIDDPGGMVAHADPVRIAQILRNLITNAERYGVPPIWIAIARSGDTIVVDVHDRGAELSLEDQDRIFQPYVRAHDDRAGVTAAVGLGLAVSHQLAELMGGSLSYHYEDGSVFRLALPSASSQRPHERLQAEDAAVS